MDEDLAACRRLLTVSYRRYIEAERARASAVTQMRGYFPPRQRPNPAEIGAPGSRIRQLVEQSERAYLRFQSAHATLQQAKTRLQERRKTASRLLFFNVRID
jgi:hypothetical protein